LGRSRDVLAVAKHGLGGKDRLGSDGGGGFGGRNRVGLMVVGGRNSQLVLEEVVDI
jgi:hypothetical protein